MSLTVDRIPLVPWADFRARLRWEQGEHIAMVGPTGQGKTTMALQLLPHRVANRGHVVVIATKPKDKTLAGLGREGYQIVNHWPPKGPANKVVLWPKFRSLRDRGAQAEVIGHGLADIFEAGGWCVLVDDVQYLVDVLGLGPQLRMFWYQARSLGISLVGATQRPRRVPVEMWSQCAHAFIWRTNSDDLKAVAELGSADTRLIREAVAMLPPHQALYVNTRTGALAVTQAAERRVAA